MRIDVVVEEVLGSYFEFRADLHHEGVFDSAVFLAAGHPLGNDLGVCVHLPAHFFVVSHDLLGFLWLGHDVFLAQADHPLGDAPAEVHFGEVLDPQPVLRFF